MVRRAADQVKGTAGHTAAGAAACQAVSVVRRIVRWSSASVPPSEEREFDSNIGRRHPSLKPDPAVAPNLEAVAVRTGSAGIREELAMPAMEIGERFQLCDQHRPAPGMAHNRDTE